MKWRRPQFCLPVHGTKHRLAASFPRLYDLHCEEKDMLSGVFVVTELLFTFTLSILRVMYNLVKCTFCLV